VGRINLFEMRSKMFNNFDFVNKSVDVNSVVYFRWKFDFQDFQKSFDDFRKKALCKSLSLLRSLRMACL